MDIGLSAASHTTLAPVEGARHLLARVQAAQRAELASLTFGDHHVVAGDSYFQNTPTLGRALAHWTGRPAGCLFLLPLWHPVLVAEQVATLAAFHDDRFILQTGLGGDAQQFGGMGRDLGQRAARFEESARIIRGLLDGATVSSELFGIEGASIGLRPVRPVEWWVGAGATVGLRRAARMGDAWYTAPGVTAESIVGPLDEYRTACERLGRPARVMVRQDATISTDPHTLAAARERVSRGYRGLRAEQVVVGTPEEAAAHLAPLADLGVEQVVIRTMAITPASDIETIEALAEVRAALD